MPEEMPEEIIEALKRVLARVTWRDAAARLGVTPQTIANLLAGSEPKWSLGQKIIALADELDRPE